MERDPSVCRAYRVRFLAIVGALSFLGVVGPLLFWLRASALDESGHGFDPWSVVWFGVASNLVVLSPLAAWYGARALVGRGGADGGLVITGAKPAVAVARMAVVGALLTLGWAAPLVPSLWRSVSPGWWTWQDVLYILLVPILSAATLVLFVHFCGVCNAAARSVAVLRWNVGDAASDVSPYRFPVPREVRVVTEQGARTLALVSRAGGEVELATCLDGGGRVRSATRTLRDAAQNVRFPRGA